MAKKLLFIFVLLFSVGRVHAQYYSWGADAAGLRWEQLRTDSVRVVFPSVAEEQGRRLFHYATEAHPYVSYGYELPPLKKIPFVIHPENFEANGLVMWMPKRIEILSTPAGTYATPWLKQLVAHEYRHAVQYAALNRGWIKVFSWFLGQQGSIVGNPFMYMWALEGDAVMIETEMTSFGRGLQPRFTIEYRAIGDEMFARRNIDKWFCGSYRDYVPDHYQLGYQLVRYSYDRYGDEFWDRSLHYSVRNAYMLTFGARVYMRKHYGTYPSKLFRDAFTNLNRHWASLPPVEDSGSVVTPLDERNYTTYRWPRLFWMGDEAEKLIAIKSDFDRPSRLVLVDAETGRERVLTHTGIPSSRIETDSERVWWTEYRRSLLFPQRVNSKIVCFDPLDGKHPRPKTVRGIRNALYPTRVGEHGLAWVEYRPNGEYRIREEHLDSRSTTRIPMGLEVHGMSWDNLTGKLYLLLIGDEGMWISSVEENGTLTQVTQPAYVTLSDLQAAAGKLYFGSIASGRDEAHCFDLATGKEHRLSTSRYGSLSPTPAWDGSLLTTTYSKRGYAVTRQQPSADGHPPVEVEVSKLPVDLVNPRMRRWNVPNLDTVRYAPGTAAAARPVQAMPAASTLAEDAGVSQPKAKRYRKAAHLFNVHSWAPVSFDPFGLIGDFRPQFMFGATVLTQNLLSTMEGYASWGWNADDKHIVTGALRYSGLGVRFEAGATYGGYRLVYPIKDQIVPEKGEQHWDAYASATLPLYFDNGYHLRQLSILSGYSYSNGLVADIGSLDLATVTQEDIATLGYNKGLHKLTFGVGFTDIVRSAYRDVQSPWGYTLSAEYGTNPVNRDFSDLVSGYARIYTPGFFPHNSLSVAATYQHSLGGFRINGMPTFGFKSSRLVPNGFSTTDISNNNYTAASVDYQFPFWYPDGGIKSVLYFKRLRLNVGGQYARFKGLNEAGDPAYKQLYSYGLDLYIDGNVLRGPAASTWTIKLSLYKPNRKGVWFGFNLATPL